MRFINQHCAQRSGPRLTSSLCDRVPRSALRLFFFALILALFCGLAPAQSPPPAAPQDGPTELIITYRCPPPRRAAFRQFITENGIQRFEHWKQDGLLKDYRFLLNWYVDVDSWDAMAVLSFSSYAQVARWKQVEHTSPGGLIRDALEMAWPLNTSSADLAWHGAAEQPAIPANSVYVVIPYDASTPADFHDSANQTLIPQLKAWLREGLASYSIYQNRYPGGKRWQGLVVLEYTDMSAFAHARSLTKPKLATERDSVVADPVIAH
jgi:hypothetical protein